MGFDEAFDILVAHCAEVGPQLAAATGHYGSSARNSTYENDIWIARIVETYRPAGQTTLSDEQYLPFYDAAWELCRIGVLRPGQHCAKGAVGVGSGGLFSPDGFSITKFGLKWLSDPDRRFGGHPSRMDTLFASFHALFGSGYSQRASEAIRSHATGSYLACSVLAGAAAESILLAVAIAKAKDEAKVLKDYSTGGGRDRTVKSVVHGLSDPIARQFKAGLYLLSYWRDNASHGKATTISEVEAYTSLATLLRLSQFCSDQWDELTTP